MSKRVIVGMSGGVDSSVAALLMRDAGYDVLGVTMKIYSGKPMSGPVADSCYGPGEQSDIEHADAVCRKLGIPYTVIDLREDYRRLVLDYARDEYMAGRTPNPCVLCNQKMKFGMMLDKAGSEAGIDYDLFATGHYVRVTQVPGTGRWALRTAVDTRKDQSYFLCMLSQEQLSRACFPLGEKTKPEVREIARQAGLITHDRPESQDFAAGGYRAVMDAADRPGQIVDSSGAVIGRHNGYWGYTVGQRKGLGVGGGAPLYVTSIDASTNTLVAGPESSLYRGDLIARDVSWAAIERPAQPVRVQVKIRYRNPAVPATATVLDDGRVRIAFDEPQRAIARGQWAVLYDGELVVAGGVIDS